MAGPAAGDVAAAAEAPTIDSGSAVATTIDDTATINPAIVVDTAADENGVPGTHSFSSSDLDGTERSFSSASNNSDFHTDFTHLSGPLYPNTEPPRLNSYVDPFANDVGRPSLMCRGCLSRLFNWNQ